MKLGFIGAGNMARAMMGGIVASGLISGNEIIVSDSSESARVRAQEDFGVRVTEDNAAAASRSEILVLAVKPQIYPPVITQIAAAVPQDAVVISIAPGHTLEKLAAMFDRKLKIVRCMPNTPAMVGEGMTAVCRNEHVGDSDLQRVRALLDAFGKSACVSEKLLDAVIAVSGSAPAYIFILIEAMADAAVLEGLHRADAYRFAAQAVLGSAKMVLQTGIHPGALKDMVCSPGGTTIEAVRVLEEKGFRSSIMEAMRACANKSKEM